MADDDLPAPAELETPASLPEPEPVEEPFEPNDAPDLGEEGGDDEADEFDDFEHDGKAYKVPKALVPHLMRDRDYTQSKQSMAETRKTLDAEKAQIEDRLKVTEAELDDRATLRAIDKQLEAYAQLTPEDWAHHEAQDPFRAQQAFRHWQQLKDQKTEVSQRLDTAGKQRTEAAQSDLTKRIQQTLDHAKKSIPGFKPDTIPQLVEFAQQLGVSDRVIQDNWSPTLVDVLHFARIGKMAVEKQKAAAKASAPLPEPTRTVSPRSPAPPTGLSDKLSPEEWVRRRNEQLRKRG